MNLPVRWLALLSLAFLSMSGCVEERELPNPFGIESEQDLKETVLTPRVALDASSVSVDAIVAQVFAGNDREAAKTSFASAPSENFDTLTELLDNLDHVSP